MYLHFDVLQRQEYDTGLVPVSSQSRYLHVGEQDCYDRYGDYSHSISDSVLSVGHDLENLDGTGRIAPLPIYKSWELRHIAHYRKPIYVERLFFRDDEHLIPYHIKTRTHNDNINNYVLYRNLEEIHRIMNGRDIDVFCRDPRVEAFDAVRMGNASGDWFSHMEFQDYIHSDRLITNCVGHRNWGLQSIQSTVNRSLKRIHGLRDDISLHEFRSVRDALLPSEDEIPLIYLSEDVTYDTVKTVQRGLITSRFGLDEVHPIDWRNDECVIPAPDSYDKLACMLESLSLTDCNVDIDVAGSGKVSGIYPVLLMDRYCDLEPKGGRDINADLFNDIVEEFTWSSMNYFQRSKHSETMIQLLRNPFLFKLLKTAHDEALILIYPQHASTNATPIFGLYFDLAVRVLGDVNTSFL